MCQDGEIRLRDGRTSADGRVEICFNERWGTVCDDQFGREEAAVVCRQQGYSPEGLLSVTTCAVEHIAIVIAKSTVVVKFWIKVPHELGVDN